MIYVDPRGVGQSDYVPGEGYTAAQLVEDIEALRLKLGIERWVILGHSFGGVSAQLYALSHPDRVAGMVWEEPYRMAIPRTAGRRGSNWQDMA